MDEGRKLAELIRYRSCEQVVLEIQSSETGQIGEELIGDVAGEGIEGEIEKGELRRERDGGGWGWKIPAREVVALEVEVAEGRKREDIIGKSPGEAIGSKAEGGQGIEPP